MQQKKKKLNLYVQINGKVRNKIIVPVDITEEQAKEAALDSDVIKKLLADRTPLKIIYVPRRLGQYCYLNKNQENKFND